MRDPPMVGDQHFVSKRANAGWLTGMARGHVCASPTQAEAPQSINPYKPGGEAPG